MNWFCVFLREAINNLQTEIESKQLEIIILSKFVIKARLAIVGRPISERWSHPNVKIFPLICNAPYVVGNVTLLTHININGYSL